jgi:hypothetical protein
VIHRGGQADFSHFSKSFGGSSITDGNALGPSIVLRGGRMSLPLEDSNIFFYKDANGTNHGAIQYCKQYFELFESFIREIELKPWQ